MPLGDQNIVFIGAGSMAEALVRGLLAAKAVEAKNITATDPRTERHEFMSKTYGIKTTDQNTHAVKDATMVVLAVKPQIVERVADEIASALPPGVLTVSICAGVPIETLRQHLPEARVFRVMPNTPSLVGEGATGIAMGEDATEDEVRRVRALFEAVGRVEIVDESLVDAVTGLSGSGPAYIFTVIEALSDAGVKVGLPRYQAQALAAQTVLGAAKLVIETGEHPGVLKDRVTSPGGTAIAGLHTLETGGLRKTLIDAVVAATQRSIELGEGKK